MYNSTDCLGTQTIYVRLRDLGFGFCPFCKMEVKELYPDSGHSYFALDGWKNQITYWYECTNPKCPSGGKFKAPQPYVLPYKKFGQDVWIFVCEEWERFKSNPEEISRRLGYKGICICEDVVSHILEDYKLLKNEGINKKTYDVVQKQGRIIVGCDGTPTESGSATLWTFYDVLSGRMLDVAYLLHADHKTLCKIFHKIHDAYGVPIACFLSDHQPSIFKASKLFDPDIPHQTCHYHFLRNQWVFLEDKDIHMNKELRKMVNGLSINKSEPKGGTFYSNNIKVEKNSFFEPLIRHLKKSVNFKKDEFNSLKGMKAFNALTLIVNQIDDELKTMDLGLRPTKQLMAMKQIINQKLNELKPEYNDLVELNIMFQLIRTTLGNEEISKDNKIEKLEEIFTELFAMNKSKENFQKRSDIKAKQSKYNLKNSLILCLWCHLWDTHKANLFFYYDIEGLEKTNIYNEQLFSQLKREVVKAHGRAHKNYMVLTRGDIYLTNICSKDAMNIQEVLTRYDLKELKLLHQPLKDKIKKERDYFRGSTTLNSSISKIAEKIRKKSWELSEKGD